MGHDKWALKHQKGLSLFLEGEPQRFRWRGKRNHGPSDRGVGERNHATSDGWDDKNQLVSCGQKQHYIIINETIFVKIVGALYHLSQINKVFILPQPFNQHF